MKKGFMNAVSGIVEIKLDSENYFLPSEKDENGEWKLKDEKTKVSDKEFLLSSFKRWLCNRIITKSRRRLSL